MPSKRGWELRIKDMLQAMEAVRTHAEGLTKDQFRSNLQAVQAVLMNFIIIGEAAAHIPPEVVEQHSEIPWARMAGMRNVLVHGYWIVDMDIIWDSVRRELPALTPLLRSLVE